MRVLASVRHVRNIQPIEGADLIVKTQVDGWQCITKKGEFNVGDFGVYFEIDSFVNASDSRFSFLSKQFMNWEGKFGARIRTIKLKGQIAQGLMLPISLFGEIQEPFEGMDVTKLLGVEKWEPPIPAQLAGDVVGGVPTFIRKTDEERIQNLIDKISTHIDEQIFEQTVKLDGTSMTVFYVNKSSNYFTPNNTGVCGRNWQLRESVGNSLWHVAKRNNLIDALCNFCEKEGRSLAIQGELIGEGIQGNNECLKGQDFYLFKIWDIEQQKFANNEDFKYVVNALKDCGATMHCVPSLGKITFKPGTTVESILAMADGPSLFAKNREGIVFQRVDGEFSFKAISNWYLEKNQNR